MRYEQPLKSSKCLFFQSLGLFLMLRRGQNSWTNVGLIVKIKFGYFKELYNDK